MAEKPNILILFTDDQRFDTIHALGNDDIHTPNMDALVHRGTAFRQAHIPSGTSAAVCMPSRAMFHTGRTLFHLDREGQSIPDSHKTIGEAFKQAGYRTYGSGKWHNGTASYARSFTDGAAIFFGGMWDHWNVPLSHFDPTGAYDNIIPHIRNFMNNNQVGKIHCDEYSNGKHSTEVISDEAIHFLNQYDDDKPFFMYLSYLAPHDPRTMPERFRNMYDPETIKLPENFMAEHPFSYGQRNIRDERLASYPRTETEIKKHIAEYYGMISHLDFEIGRVMKALQDNGYLENTIVVLAGDNGLAVGQHGLMGKQSHYEHSIRVPLVFAGPNIPKGEYRDQYVYLLDVFPTLCELTGIEIPASVEGQSLLPIMNNADAKLREHLYFAYTDSIRSVKNHRYKLVEYAGKIRYTQLFDLQEDPMEMNNLMDSKEMEETVRTLRKKLQQFRHEWEDSGHRYSDSYWTNYNETDIF